MNTTKYPRLERGPLIEIPKLVNGRPSYECENSDDNVVEVIKMNGYEFTEDGERI